jgi:PAS domain S-box-containing protein
MALHRWVLGRKTTAGYAVVAVAVAIATLASIAEVREARHAGDVMNHALTVSRELARLEIDLLDTETGQRGYLLTGDASYLAPYERGAAAAASTLTRLQQLTARSPAQQQRLAEIERLVTNRLDELQATVDEMRAGSPDTAMAIVRAGFGKQTMDRIRALLVGAQLEESAALSANRPTRQARYLWANRLAIGSSALALIAVVLSTVALNRRTRSQQGAAWRLRESQERLRVTLQSIGDAVIATDPLGQIVFMNHVAAQLTGWREDEARGRPLDEVFRIVDEQTRRPAESPVTKVLREGVVVGLANHTVLIKRNGNEVPIDDSGAPIRDAGSAVMGVVLVFRDITEHKEMEAKRDQLLHEEAARRAAERANAAKDEFLAVLSHELRSPLQGILSWLAVLRLNDGDAAQEQRALDAIERGARQQARLVNDLLDASRIVAGKLQVEQSPVPVAAIVDACVEEIGAMADEQGIELHSEVTDCGLVRGDRHRLHQSVANLLANALKFTPSGGRIAVRCAIEGSEAVISVLDSGEGIAPEFLPFLFDRFSQGAAARRRSSGGLGLGLSIARQIIELHGGTITAHSEGPGRGARFEIRLPVAPGSEGETAPPRRGRPGRSSLSGLSVLVVDDDADTRQSLSLLLALHGAITYSAGSVKEALAATARERPAVLVSDISMPDEDGYHLIAALRHERGVQPIVIALTGFAIAEDRERATRAGFDAHIAKPVDVDELVTMIRTLVEQRRDDSA